MKFYDLLPLVIKLQDAEASGGAGIDPILERVTDRLLQDEYDTHVALINGLRELYDCLRVENPYRTLLFQFLGQQRAEGWAESLERFVLCETIPWHKISGTVHGWEKTMAYRLAGAYDFFELYKTEVNEIGDYFHRSNATYPYRAARIGIAPDGLFPYEQADTITIVPPYVPGPPTPTESDEEIDYDAETPGEEIDYETFSSLFLDGQKIVSPDRVEGFRFGRSVAMNGSDSPYITAGNDLFIGEPYWNHPSTGFFHQGRVHRYRKDSSDQWVLQQTLTTPTTNPITDEPWTDNMLVGSSLLAYEDYLWVMNQSEFAWIFKRQLDDDYTLVDWTERSASDFLRRPVAMGTHPESGTIYVVSLVRTPAEELTAFTDEFTDSDGTLLTAHTSDSGHSWLAPNGSHPEINSNRVDAVIPFRAANEIDYDFGPDMVVQATVKINDSHKMGVIGRAVFESAFPGRSDYIIGYLSESGIITIEMKDSSGFTTLETGTVVHDVSVPVTLTLSFTGTTITLSTDDETISTTTTYNQTETRAGIIYWTSDSSATNPGYYERLDVIDPAQDDLDSLQLFQENAMEDGFDTTGSLIEVTDVTSISASNEYVAVGRGLVESGGVPWVGQVDIYRVYEDSPGSLDLEWVRTLNLPEEDEAITKALSEGDTGPQFGRDVFLRGSELAVATKWPHVEVPTDSGGTVRFRGGAYLYYDMTGNGGFQFFQELTRNTPDSIEGGGGTGTDFVNSAYSVFIGDGYVAVGSINDHWDSNFANWYDDPTGSVTIYEGVYSYNGYLETQTLTPFGINGRQDANGSDSDEPMNFGFVLAGADDSLAVGTPGDNFDEDGINEVVDAGAVYVFDRNVTTVNLPDDREPLICLDFAVLPVGGVDLTYDADDTTSILAQLDQLPPQYIDPPPSTFTGPFNLIGVRLRAWAPATATLILNHTLASDDLDRRTATVSSMTVQEFEFWWDADDLGVTTWNDSDVDWSSFWIQFQTEENPVYITAAELIVRQAVEAGDSGTIQFELAPTDVYIEQSRAGYKNNGGYTLFGGPRAGAYQQLSLGSNTYTILHAYFNFAPVTPGDVLRPGMTITRAFISNLYQAGRAWFRRFNPVLVTIRGRPDRQDYGVINDDNLTAEGKDWLVPISESGTGASADLLVQETPDFSNVIQDFIDHLDYDPDSFHAGRQGVLLLYFVSEFGLDNVHVVGYEEKQRANIVDWPLYDETSGFGAEDPVLEVDWTYTEVQPQTSCLQACECVCQSGCEIACQVASESVCGTAAETGCVSTCETNCQNLVETASCQGQCQVATEEGTNFSVPVDQDGIPELQYELEGRIEVNACLGNVIRYTDAIALLERYFHDQRPIHVLPIYCVTVADLPEVAPQAGDEFYVRVNPRFEDQANSPQSDSLTIIPDCTQGCQVSCETFCEVGCEDNCQGVGACENSCQLNCEATCQTDCEVVCQSGCVISCQNDSCQSFCQSSCEEVCQVACEDVCQGACEIAGCQLSCTQGCEDNCQFDCQTACEFDCQSPAEQACQTSCQDFCQSCCQEACEAGSCQTTCEQVCQASCVSGCEEACETNCQDQCETACVSACEISCQIACQGGGCEIFCEGGCQSGCQSICEITCEGASCQQSCEGEGCQSCCECQCQSDGCESGCTSGCTSGCQQACESACQAAGGCETGCEQSCEGSSEACSDCCEVCCEDYTEYGCSFGSCESACTASACQSACQTSCQDRVETMCEDSCQTEDQIVF